MRKSLYTYRGRSCQHMAGQGALPSYTLRKIAWKFQTNVFLKVEALSRLPHQFPATDNGSRCLTEQQSVIACFGRQLKQRRQVCFLRSGKGAAGPARNGKWTRRCGVSSTFSSDSGRGPIGNFAPNCCVSRRRDFDCSRISMSCLRIGVSLDP